MNYNSTSYFSGRSILTLLFTFLTLSVFGQTTRYVSTTGTNSDPASATSWATSTTDLQGAINSVSATGGQVFVASGLYLPGGPTNTDRTVSFSIASGVQVYGGYVGSGSPGPRTAYPSIGAPTGTTLSGEIGDPARATDNSYHVVQFKNASASTRLDGVVITGGRAEVEEGYEFPNNAGGGVFNDGSGNGNRSIPVLTNIVFSQNLGSFGGAMLNFGNDGDSSPVLTNVIFLQNIGFNGGAMYNSGLRGNSSPVLTNVSFSQNMAESGGAMYNVSFNGNSGPVLTNVVVFGNMNTFNSGAALTASYSLFDGDSFINGPGNISTTTSPFVDAPAGNLQLRAGTEAIDAGNNAAYNGPTTDLAGNPRLVGCRIDMGAYESPNAVQFAPNPSVFTQSTPEGFSVQLTDGVQYERLKMVDRINGYQIQGSEINATGYFLLPQAGTYPITVVGANGCRTVVSVVVP